MKLLKAAALIMSFFTFAFDRQDIYAFGFGNYTNYTEHTTYDIDNLVTNNEAGAFTQVGKILPIQWETTHTDDTPATVTARNAYRIRLPKELRPTLIEYLNSLELSKHIRRFLPFAPVNLDDDNIGVGTYPVQTWNVRRPGSQWRCSEMYFLSPADENSHQSYLKSLGEGGLDDTLEAIGRSLDLDGISCYQLSFIVAYKCDRGGYIHLDFNNTGAKAFHLLIPLILEPDSKSELDIVDIRSESIGRLKYEYEVGVLVGDGVLHATPEQNYIDDESSSGFGFRLMASIMIADINPENVENLEISQPYPPYSEELFLKQSGNHWRSDDDNVRLPHNLSPHEVQAIIDNELFESRLESKLAQVKADNHAFEQDLQNFEHINARTMTQIEQLLEEVGK